MDERVPRAELSERRTRGVVRAILLAGVAFLTAIVAFNVRPPVGTQATASVLLEAADVAAGRVPMVDTSATNGWLVLDALGGLFAVVAPTEGRMMLTASVLAVVVALLLLALGRATGRTWALGLLAGATAVVAVVLGPELPDAYAPTAGALTLVAPVLVAVCAALGAHSHRWRTGTLGALAVSIVWSPAAGVLALVAVAAGASAWPGGLRAARGPLARAVLAAVSVYTLALVVRAGAVPSPAAFLAALRPPPRLDEPGPEAAAVLAWLALATGAVAHTVRGPDGRRAAAVRTATALSVTVGLWGVVAGNGLAVGYAVGLAGLVLVGHGGVRAALAAVLVVLSVLPHGQDRWRGTVAYDALPHGLLAKVGFGPHVGGTLRYDLERLARRAPLPPVPSPDVVLVDGPLAARVLERTGTVSRLPTGDPTRSTLAPNLDARVDEAIARLPDPAVLFTQEDVFGLALRGERPAEQTAVFEVLERVVARRRAVLEGTVYGVLIVSLHRRAP